VTDDRQRLAATFDSAADLYQQARPEYPQQLFDTLVEVAGLQPGDRLLEVGCATGKATLPLARRGYRITCIEIGAELAAAARGNLADFAHVDVVESAYDADGYLRLLDTFSGHIAMEPWQRDRLYGEIRRRLGQRVDGRLRRHWGAVLQVARRGDTARVP